MIVALAGLALVWAAVAQADATVPADFADAAVARIDLLSGAPYSSPDPITFSDLETRIEQLASTSGYVYDPQTGNVWDVPTLLQRASGQSTWLDDSATVSARELQIRQVFGLLTWRLATNSATVANSVSVSASDQTGGSFSSCTPGSNGHGATTSSDLRSLWSQELQRAASATPAFTGTSGTIGVGSFWSEGEGKASVSITREVDQLTLPQSGSFSAPLPNHYLNGAELLVTNGFTSSDKQQPPNMLEPLTAAAAAVPANYQMTPSDYQRSDTALGGDSQITLGTSAYKASWQVPLQTVEQADTAANPQLVQALLLRIAAQEPPSGFPATELDSICNAQFFQSVGPDELIYSEELPAVTGSAAAIDGLYHDAGGNAIAGATVNLSAADGPVAQTTTDALGHYEFDQLAGGTYEVDPTLPPPGQPAGGQLALDRCTASQCSATAGGFSLSVAATSGSGSRYSVDFHYQPPSAKATGTYRDATGAPIVGATLRASADQGAGGGTATTDVQGRYEIGGLGPGAYHVTPQGTPPGQNAGGTVVVERCLPGTADPAGSCATALTAGSAATADFRWQLPDLRAENLEVTQGIQQTPWSTPSALPIPGFTSLVAGGTYAGVPLVEGVPTVARFYANVNDRLIAAAPLHDVTARLHAYRDSGGALSELPGSPIAPDSAPGQPGGLRDLPLGPTLSADLLSGARTDPAGAYTFTLPLTWTMPTPPSAHPATITLVAEVNPPGPGGIHPIREYSYENDARAVGSVQFHAERTIAVTPVRIEYTFPGETAKRVGPDLSADFRRARQVLPVRADHLELGPYATAPIADITTQIAGLVSTWRPTSPRLRDCITANGGCRALFWGIVAVAARSAAAPAPDEQEYTFGFSPVDDGVSYTDAGSPNRGISVIGPSTPPRPLTSTAHELMHQLGFGHAGAMCPGIGANGQTGDPWPPDEMGYIQGIGLDRVPASGGAAGPYRIIAPGIGQPQWYDPMSYCANTSDRDAWISTRNWTRFVDQELLSRSSAAPGATRAVRGAGAAPHAAAARPALGVDAVVLPGGKVAMIGVRHEVTALTASTRGAPYEIVERGSGGRVLARVTLAAEPFFDGPSGGMLSAVLPAAPADAIQIVHAGKVVAERTRNRRPPRVRLLFPRRHGRLPASGKLTLEWRIRGAGRAVTQSEVDYSADNGRHWKALVTGLPGTSVTLDAAMFTHASRPRIRVVVNDGFNDVAAVSGPLRTSGRARR